MATELKDPDGKMDGIRDGWVMGGDGGWLEVGEFVDSYCGG